MKTTLLITLTAVIVTAVAMAMTQETKEPMKIYKPVHYDDNRPIPFVILEDK